MPKSSLFSLTAQAKQSTSYFINGYNVVDLPREFGTQPYLLNEFEEGLAEGPAGQASRVRFRLF
jgi:hypothetical protein